MSNLMALAAKLEGGAPASKSIETPKDMRGRLITAKDMHNFVLAGNARLTLVSEKTGKRYTYRVRRPREAAPGCPHFVSVMYGADNETEFTFMGSIFKDGNYRHSAKSNLSPGDIREKGFEYFWSAVRAGKIPMNMQVWHEGRCCRCGRALTVPESIHSGIGPECRKHVGQTMLPFAA